MYYHDYCYGSAKRRLTFPKHKQGNATSLLKSYSDFPLKLKQCVKLCMVYTMDVMYAPPTSLSSVFLLCPAFLFPALHPTPKLTLRCSSSSSFQSMRPHLLCLSPCTVSCIQNAFPALSWPTTHLLSGLSLNVISSESHSDFPSTAVPHNTLCCSVTAPVIFVGFGRQWCEQMPLTSTKVEVGTIAYCENLACKQWLIRLIMALC